MAENVNLQVMELFPYPEQLPENYDRRAALLAMWSVAMAARGAFDEITDRATGLSKDERWSAGAIAEQLTAKVAELEDLLTE